MPNPYTRQQVLDRLNANIARGEPILGAGAGIGLSAKFIERGGGDLIIIYNSGRFRMSGHSSLCGLLAYGDANAIVMEMGEREVLPVVKETPVIAGVNGTDPTRRMWHFLRQVRDMGFSGVNNFPTVGLFDGSIRQELEETGLGFYREVEMIRIAHEMDLFTITYTCSPEEARMMAEAGADAIIVHVGLTAGGSIGMKRTRTTLEEAAQRVREQTAAVRAVRQDALILAHGGPIANPPDADYIYQHTEAVGFIGASSIERLASEPAIEATTAAFKKLRLRSRS
jgi:predicted TIM-barrel enzyme